VRRVVVAALVVLLVILLFSLWKPPYQGSQKQTDKQNAVQMTPQKANAWVSLKGTHRRSYALSIEGELPRFVAVPPKKQKNKPHQKENINVRVGVLLSQLHVPDQLLVRLKPGCGGEVGRIRRLVGALKHRVVHTDKSGVLLRLWLRRGSDLASALKALLKDDAVKYAEPNYILFAAYVPNDPFFASSSTWGQSYKDLWGLHRVGAQAAWDASKGDGVVVAVIDSGCDLSHPDIADNLWTNSGEIAGNGQDDDNNGYVDDVHGWDFVNQDADPSDDKGHGTHCAGTIAAVGDNSEGVVGLAFKAKIMVLKGLSASGGGTVGDLSEALYYAADNGARVVNCSWGGPGDSQTLHDAVIYAHDKGCVVVAAAGNDNDNADGYIPAKWSQTITVAATDPYDNRATFSNWGTCIDVAAPGVDILSLRASGTGYGLDVPGYGNYCRAQGTSMAAPHVSALAALILAAHPNYTPEQVRNVIRSSAYDLGDAGFDVYFGYGRIDAAAALGVSDSGVAEITQPASNETVGGMVEVRGTATADNLSGWSLDVGEGAAPSSWQNIAQGVNSVQGGLLGEWDTTAFADGYWTLRLQVFSTTGRVFEDRVSVYVNNATPSVRVIVTPSSATLKVGESIQFHATTEGGTDTLYRWETSDSTVATVGLYGKVEALSVGSCRVTAKGDLTRVQGEASVKVVKPEVTISPIGGLKIGETAQLQATTEYGFDSGYEWHSEDPAIAEVDAGGKVTAISPGRAKVVAVGKDSGAVGSIEVHVLEDSIRWSDDEDMWLLCAHPSEHKFYFLKRDANDNYSVFEYNADNGATREVALDSQNSPYSNSAFTLDSANKLLYIACRTVQGWSGYWTVAVVDIENMHVRTYYDLPERTDTLAVDGKGRLFTSRCIANASDGTLICSHEFGQETVYVPGDIVVSISYPGPNKEIYLRSWDVSATPPQMLAEVKRYEKERSPTHVYVNPRDPTEIFVTLYAESHFDVRRASDLEILRVIRVPEKDGDFHCWKLAVGYDLVAALHNGRVPQVCLLDAVNGAEIRRWRCPDEWPMAALTSDDAILCVHVCQPYHIYSEFLPTSHQTRVVVVPEGCTMVAATTGRLRGYTYGKIQDASYHWWSSNPQVVDVDADGNLQAKATGRAVIYARGAQSNCLGCASIEVISDPHKERVISFSGYAYCCACSHQKDLVCVGVDENYLFLFRSDTGSFVDVIPLPDRATLLDVSPSGEKAAAVLEDLEKLAIIDLSSRKVEKLIPLSRSFSWRNRHLFSLIYGAADTVHLVRYGFVYSYSVTQGKLVSDKYLSPTSLDYTSKTPDGKYFVGSGWSSSYGDGTGSYDISTGIPIEIVRTNEYEGMVGVAPDFTKAIISSHVRDPRTLSLLFPWKVAGGRHLFSRDGSRIFFDTAGYLLAARCGGVGELDPNDYRILWFKRTPSSGYHAFVCSKSNKLLYLMDWHFVKHLVLVPTEGHSNPLAEIRGRLIDAATGKPIAGAFVRLLRGCLSVGTRSDENGYFSIIGILPATYHLVVERPGYGTLYETNLELKAGQLISGLVLSLSTQTLAVTSTSLPDGKVFINYSAQLQADYGTTPYTWNISSGSLPPGLSLNPSTGEISGIPTTSGTYSFTATVTDANNTTASKSFTITIAPPQITVTSITERFLGPSVTTSDVTWQCDCDIQSWSVEVGGTGSQGSGTQIASGSNLAANTPATFTVAETDIPDDTTQKIYIYVDTGYETVKTYFVLTDDHTEPSVQMTTPAPNSTVGACPAISGTASDTASGVALVQVAIQNSGGNFYDPSSGQFNSTNPVWMDAVGTANWSLDTTALPWTADTYTVHLHATDNAGNSAITTASFTLDPLAPTVSLVSFSPADRVIGPSVDLVVTWRADKDGTYTIEVGGTGTQGSGTQIAAGSVTANTNIQTTITATDITDNATETVWIYVDSGGDIGSTHFDVTDDQTAPSVQIMSPSNNTTLSSGPQKVEGTAFDAGGSHVLHVRAAILDKDKGLYWDPQAGDFATPNPVWIAATGTSTWQVDTGAVLWQAGERYQVEVEAEDAVGNVGSSQVVFSIKAHQKKKHSGGGCLFMRNADDNPFSFLLPLLTLSLLLLVRLLKRKRYGLTATNGG